MKKMKKVREIKKSKIMFIGIFIAMVIVFVYIYIVQSAMIQEQQAKLVNINEKIESEKKINTQLKKKKEDLNSDEYIEKIAREKLGMVKAGEKIFIDVNK